MSGRIKLMDESGLPLFAEDTPKLEYEYDEISPFDETCGTFNTSDFRLPDGDFANQCPERFVCEIADERSLQSDDTSSNLQAFSTCLDAMNCAMMVGMTTHATSPIGLFIHQMIPHHQNAVNMAKALLKTGGLTPCEDLTNGDDPVCVMEALMYEIIHGQNHQIQTMRSVLESLEEPAYADCVVVHSSTAGNVSDSEASPSSGVAILGHGLLTLVTVYSLVSAMML